MSGEDFGFLTVFAIAALVGAVFIKSCTTIVVGGQNNQRMEHCISARMEWVGGDCVKEKSK